MSRSLDGIAKPFDIASSSMTGLSRVVRFCAIAGSFGVGLMLGSCTDDTVGGEGSACDEDDDCADDLACVDGACVPPDETGDGDGSPGDGAGEPGGGDGGPGYGDGSPGDGDGDGDPAMGGDAVLDRGEACDGGNDDNTDTCLDTCELASCGDGFVGPGEGCDDGNDIDDDACSNACALSSCGDGRVQEGE